MSNLHFPLDCSIEIGSNKKSQRDYRNKYKEPNYDLDEISVSVGKSFGKTFLNIFITNDPISVSPKLDIFNVEKIFILYDELLSSISKEKHEININQRHIAAEIMLFIIRNSISIKFLNLTEDNSIMYEFNINNFYHSIEIFNDNEIVILRKERGQDSPVFVTSPSYENFYEELKKLI